MVTFLGGKDLSKIATVTNPVPVEIVSGVTSGTNLEGLGFITVGTSQVELAFTGTTESIIITSDSANTGRIFIGKTGVNITTNFIDYLEPGASFIIDYDDVTNGIFVISDTAAQQISAGASL